MKRIYVKAPPGNGYTTPSAMKRVDDHLCEKFTAIFTHEGDLPKQEADGTWEVRVFGTVPLDLVKGLLREHYGLMIVREVDGAVDIDKKVTAVINSPPRVDPDTGCGFITNSGVNRKLRDLLESEGPALYAKRPRRSTV